MKDSDMIEKIKEYQRMKYLVIHKTFYLNEPANHIDDKLQNVDVSVSFRKIDLGLSTDDGFLIRQSYIVPDKDIKLTNEFLKFIDVDSDCEYDEINKPKFMGILMLLWRVYDDTLTFIRDLNNFFPEKSI